jgi:multiple sugar transport system substrate-binding protein
MLTRRHTIGLAAGLAVGSSLGARAAVMPADVPQPKLPIEPGAKLRVLRPAKFVDPDEAIFTANAKKWGEQAGVEIRVDYLAWDNMPAQTAVVANTGAGPDIVLGFGPDAQIYADKLIELTDVAEYLGAKYGGWYPLSTLFGRAWKKDNWLGIPMGGTTGPANYRVSWCKEAGFDAIPNDLAKFLDLRLRAQPRAR